MIHHYLTQEEILHLNELHTPKSCASCIFSCPNKNMTPDGSYDTKVSCVLYPGMYNQMECIDYLPNNQYIIDTQIRDQKKKNAWISLHMKLTKNKLN